MLSRISNTRPIVLTLLLLTAPMSGMAEQALSFGIVPQQAASKLARLWAPILKHLSDESGVQLSFRTAPDIPEFERRVLAGDYDIAYMNPYHYTVFHETPGYRVFARQGDKRIRGIIVAPRNSPITSLNELEGKTLAFPAPAAFAASVLPRAELKARDITIEPRYVSSHDSVYRAVAKGLYPAGGGIERTLANVDERTRAQLKVIWRTEAYTPHAIAAHPRVPSDTINAVLKAMVEMRESDQGRHLLKSIKFKGIEAAKNSDWDDVRGLQLNELSGLGTQD